MSSFLYIRFCHFIFFSFSLFFSPSFSFSYIMDAHSKKQIVSVFLQPVLDPFSKRYCDVITLSAKPVGPLSQFVRFTSFPKLSEFRGNDSTNQCAHVLLRHHDFYSSNGSCCSYSYSPSSCKYMNQDDIFELFSFLVSNGYVIEEGLSKVVSRLDHSRQFICMFSYPIVTPVSL